MPDDMPKKDSEIFKIGGREIGKGQPVFMVAEISANHKQSLPRAKKLVEAACRAGADAVKLQIYTPDTMTINCDNEYFQIKPPSPWQGKNLYQLYQEAQTPWEWYPVLKKIAQKYNALLFATPFDETAVDFLEKMKTPAYKIASYELVDVGLLKKVAKTRKPVIITRAMASQKEVQSALNTLRQNGAQYIAVLHCVNAYPAKPDEMNLATIADIAKKFKVLVGLSDHSLSVATAAVAVASGASIIEKHFTLKRTDGGPDAGFSLEPPEFKSLVQAVRETEKMIGQVEYGATKQEAQSLTFRRSLFVVEDIKKGDVFNRGNIRSIRPGYGLPPRFLSKILGKRAKSNIKKGTPLKWQLII